MENKKLYTLKCSTCSENTPKLDLNQINKNLDMIINWKKNNENEMIFKKFKFKKFTEVLKFVNIVGNVAEDESHHPDISFGYNYCLILIHTHAIKGLSMNDFILASKIDQISL